MAAAYRSEQRRLLSFIRMADFMMCDTLQTVLLESVSEMLAIMQPTPWTGVAPGFRPGGAWPDMLPMSAPSGTDSGLSSSGMRPSGGFSSADGASRSLQAMSTMLNGSRRQRMAAAVAGMQLSPVTVAQQAAAAAATAAAAEAAEVNGVHVAISAVAPRVPLLELEVVMQEACTELVFAPGPEQLQVCVYHP